MAMCASSAHMEKVHSNKGLFSFLIGALKILLNFFKKKIKSVNPQTRKGPEEEGSSRNFDQFLEDGK